MKSVLESALKKGEEANGVTVGSYGLNEAILAGDLNKDKMIKFSEFCNILLKLHVVYAIQNKNIENAKRESYNEQFATRNLLRRILFHDYKQ